MKRMGNYTKAYVAALVARTKAEFVVEPPKKKARPSPGGLAQMDAEMQALEKDILGANESYGRDVVNLTLAQRYVKRLLENAKVVKYLAAKHADVLTEFQRMQENAALDG